MTKPKPTQARLSDSDIHKHDPFRRKRKVRTPSKKNLKLDAEIVGVRKKLADVQICRGMLDSKEESLNRQLKTLLRMAVHQSNTPDADDAVR